MKLRVLSDLHNEFDVFEIPPMDGDQNTVLILAGDIDLTKHRFNLIEFLTKASKQFRDVIYVFGNHEFYRGYIQTDRSRIKTALFLESICNVHILEDSSIVIDDVMFIGSTLWTSFRNGCPILMENARNYMNDYSYIKLDENEKDYSKNFLLPSHIFEINKTSKEFLFNEIKNGHHENLKTVVITHHSPSYCSITSAFKHDKYNDLYHNNYDYDIEEAKPNIWVHGHTHQNVSYEIGTTKVLSNTRGYYPKALNKDFDPFFMVEV